MWMKNIDPKTAAILTQMYAENHAKKLMDRLELDMLDWTEMFKLLDFHFMGDPEDEAVVSVGGKIHGDVEEQAVVRVRSLHCGQRCKKTS